jgi:D-alanyl-lipoteichoic acid acyltransferase DltB (MBOAT superfamily)
MNFNSFEFGVFFVTVWLLYLILPHKPQNWLLLGASYLFYSFWDWRFLLLIIFSTSVDFFCARHIFQNRLESRRKLFLSISIGANLGTLVFFKYFNFFLDNFFHLFALFGISLHAPIWNVILPVGISFYTFQTMSYSIDVYRKQLQPAKNFLDYALFVSFFPQLVAGPIERAKNLLPQILNPRKLDADKLTEGFFLIYWGLFKKIFIADNLGSFLAYFAKDRTLFQDGGFVWASTLAFLFQLYCDFSAYSDIARGTARLLGFDLMLNFRSPFFASNIQETWNRWHISLTTWIRDYLYFPLAKTKFFGKYLDARIVVVVTFLIMGLWHGAAWNFVIWGGYNGLILVGYSIFARKSRKFRKPKSAPLAWLLRFASVFLTLNFAAFGLLFFRATSFAEMGQSLIALFTNFKLTPLTLELLARCLLYAAPMLLVDGMLFLNENLQRLFKTPVLARVAFLYVTFYLMVVFRAQGSTFIYFQF